MSNKGYNNLTQLKNDIQKCKKCELYKSRKIAVPGNGPKNANVILIGEAPGAEEDTKGKPFCGRGGKLLDKVLINNNLLRKKMYVTNIVKCRPPNNRKPKKEEIQSCSEYLQNEIRLINPELITLLGRTAVENIHKKLPISKNHGKISYKSKRKFLITYHPAAILRNPKLSKTFSNDLKKIKSYIGSNKKNDQHQKHT